MAPTHASLLRFVRGYVDLPQSAEGRLLAGWEAFALSPGEALLGCGQTCGHLYFLEAGLLRYYALDAEGGEVTKFFTEPPYLFTALRSYNSGRPSREGISAVVASRGLRLTRDAAAELDDLPAWNTFVRLLIAEVQGFTEDILVAASTQTPEERYAALVRERPALLRQLPLKYLASYLGIAPQSLSRIRRRLAD